jgi:hypothetical protein
MSSPTMEAVRALLQEVQQHDGPTITLYLPRPQFLELQAHLPQAEGPGFGDSIEVYPSDYIVRPVVVAAWADGRRVVRVLR